MKFKTVFMAIALIGASFVTACSQKTMQTSQRVITIDVAKANEIIASDPQIAILDVRTPEEFESGHVRNAANIDFKSPEFGQMISQLPKDKPYVVYCRSGHRSGLAMDAFKQLGFSKVYNVAGGISAWQQSGLPK
jgi:rhodanese-related sulfurtransferase